MPIVTEHNHIYVRAVGTLDTYVAKTNVASLLNRGLRVCLFYNLEDFHVNPLSLYATLLFFVFSSEIVTAILVYI